MRPMSAMGVWTVVSGGEDHSISGSPSNPTTLRSRGTASPTARAAATAPSACASLVAKIAVGGRRRRSSSRALSRASTAPKSPGRMRSGSAVSPAFASAARNPCTRAIALLASGTPESTAMRRCPSSIRCSVAASPPAQLVTPTLGTSSVTTSGSTRTSGTRAAASARRCGAETEEVTTIAPCRPAAATRSTHAAAPSPGVIVSTSSSPSSSAAWVTPRITSSV